MSLLAFVIFAAPTTAPPPAAAAAPISVREASPGQYVVSAAGMSDLDWARAARIVPHYKDGQPIGFRLYGLRRGRLFGLLGFRNGDTITAVNGRSLTSPDAALELYGQIRQAKTVTVSLLRRGEPLTHTYVIEGDGHLDLPALDRDLHARRRPRPPPEGVPIDVVGRLTLRGEVELGAGSRASGQLEVEIADLALVVTTEQAEPLRVPLGTLRATLSVDHDADEHRWSVRSLSAEQVRVQIGERGIEARGRRLGMSRLRAEVDVTLSEGLKAAAPRLEPLLVAAGAIRDGTIRVMCAGSLGRPRCQLRAPPP